MKVLLDHNLPPNLARALNELSKRFNIPVIALRDKFNHDDNDLSWLGSLAEEGGWVVISKDKFAKKKGAEKAAIKQQGIHVFVLKGKNWRLQYWDMAYKIVQHFPKIIDKAETSETGIAYSVSLQGNISLYK